MIYTPTVGEACREFSHIIREPKGFFITPDDKGRIARILGNWPEKDIRVTGPSRTKADCHECGRGRLRDEARPRQTAA